MNRARYWVGAFVVVAAIGYLMFTGASESTVPYKTITEVKTDPTISPDTGLRMVGFVANGSIHAAGNREVQFTVHSEGDSIRARYRGVVPDTFKDGAEVVLEGRLSESGSFHATTLLAKCPSKYESAEQHPDAVGREAAGSTDKATGY